MAKRLRVDGGAVEVSVGREGGGEVNDTHLAHKSPLSSSVPHREEDEDEGEGVAGKGYVSKELSLSPLRDNVHLPHLHGCRSVENYERLNFINEGTYGRVWRARDVQTGTIYALKEVKLFGEQEGFPITCLREIDILLSIRHVNIVNVREVVVGSSMDKVYMVMEYCPHDLKDILSHMKQPYSQSEVKSLMLQILAGVNHLHENWVLHRDMKTSNLLLTNDGVLKLCDFGLARQYSDPSRDYSLTVVTLWYRAPEILLGSRTYTPALDIWSVGCIFAELLTLKALLPGEGELDQLDRMSKLLGSPTDKIWPGMGKLPNAKKIQFARQPHNYLRRQFPANAYAGKVALTNNGFDLLNSMLTYDPTKRITAAEALQHPFFSEAPLPKDPALIQTFPEDLTRRNKK